MFTLTIFDLKSTNVNLHRLASSGSPRYRCHFTLLSFLPFSFIVTRKSRANETFPTSGFSGVFALVDLLACDSDLSDNAPCKLPLAPVTGFFMLEFSVFCIIERLSDSVVTAVLTPPNPSALASTVMLRAKYLSISSS